jgi:antitoxin component of MazEF toxin-antitoxin module
MTKVEFIGKLAKQGNRFAVFIPARYVDKNIRKLHEAKNVKVIIHDDL